LNHFQMATNGHDRAHLLPLRIRDNMADKQKTGEPRRNTNTRRPRRKNSEPPLIFLSLYINNFSVQPAQSIDSSLNCSEAIW